MSWLFNIAVISKTAQNQVLIKNVSNEVFYFVISGIIISLEEGISCVITCLELEIIFKEFPNYSKV